jgi:hypothetical protein
MAEVVAPPATISWEPRQPNAQAAALSREASSLFERLSPVPSSPVRNDGGEEGCEVCLKRFGMAAKKKFCRRCGDGFCGDCSTARRDGPPRYCDQCSG